MIGVIADHLLRERQHNFENLAARKAGIEKRLQIFLGDFATAAKHLQGEGPQRLERGNRLVAPRYGAPRSPQDRPSSHARL